MRTFGGYDKLHIFLKKVVFDGECRILLCISVNPGLRETPMQPALAFIFHFFDAFRIRIWSQEVT